MVKKVALEEHVLRGVRAEPDAKIARRQAREANGICSAGPLIWAIAAPGPDRVTFAADYPFDATEEAPHFIDSGLPDEVRDNICFNNVARFLELKGG
jgi:predicted TIM-barrel fold metal-dependent hydrolase